MDLLENGTANRVDLQYSHACPPGTNGLYQRIKCSANKCHTFHCTSQSTRLTQHPSAVTNSVSIAYTIQYALIQRINTYYIGVHTSGITQLQRTSNKRVQLYCVHSHCLNQGITAYYYIRTCRFDCRRYHCTRICTYPSKHDIVVFRCAYSNTRTSNKSTNE